MIRARGTGIDVPVWVEREVLCPEHVLMKTDFRRPCSGQKPERSMTDAMPMRIL